MNKLIKIVTTLIAFSMIVFGIFSFFISSAKLMANYDGPLLKPPGHPILLLYFGIALVGGMYLGILYRKEIAAFFKDINKNH